MEKISAGIVLFRRVGDERSIEVLLVHPGGPFWATKDLGAWSIPKGEPNQGEDLLDVARREFEEEIGRTATGGTAAGDARPLGSIKQPGGKTVHAWAIEGDFDPARLESNRLTMEWPRGSGRMREFPEVDRAAWFSLPEARRRILEGQLPLLERLEGLGGLEAWRLEGLKAWRLEGLRA